MTATMNDTIAKAKAAEKEAKAKADVAEQFQHETQDWYDWQMQHLQEIAEQATVKNDMLIRAKTELHDKVATLEATNRCPLPPKENVA